MIKRKSNVFRFLSVLWFCLSAGQAAHAEILAEDVLARSATHLPTILKAQAAIEKQQGALLSARGAFDRTLDSDTDIRALGYYDGRSSSVTLNQPIEDFYGRVYGQYRISDGLYPLYEGKLETQSGGEVAVGAIFSLLRNREIDPRRFGVFDETLRLQEAELALELEQLNAQMTALLIYWEWLANGLEYRVRQDLWQLANERQDALEQEVKAGNKAQMFLIENRQNILKRKAALRDAKRQLQNSAQALSFYYRNEEGVPLIPDADDVPEGFSNGWMLEQQTHLLDAETELLLTVEALVNRRPDMQLLALQNERFEQRKALAENNLLPQLDVLTEFSQDLGRDEFTQEDTESRIKLQLSIPLQTREARGRIRMAEAEMRMIALERDRLMQEMMIALQTILNDLRIGEELMEVTAEEVEVAEQLLEAERQRFRNGASDFFLLNLREETLANARVSHVIASQKYMDAVSRYLAVTMHKPALGL